MVFSDFFLSGFHLCRPWGSVLPKLPSRVLLGFWMFLACDMAFNDPRANKVLIKGPRRVLHRELSCFELVWSGSDLVCFDSDKILTNA